jgi:hypothetical protein
VNPLIDRDARLELVKLLRERASTAELAAAASLDTPPAAYVSAYAEAWQDAASSASHILATHFTSRADVDVLEPLVQTYADLARHHTRHHTPPETPGSLTPDQRRGRRDAYTDAMQVACMALGAAQQRAAAAAQTGPPPPDNPDLGDWSGYPRVPVERLEDFRELCLFLGGETDSFTGELLLLIRKADRANKRALAKGFPRHVHAMLVWDYLLPAAADNTTDQFLRLLRAASHLGVFRD